jgi:hypothetical protein
MFGKSSNPVAADPGTVLLLQVPRTNEKKELAAEQMFASLHGLLTTAQASFFKTAVHERVSFEIAVQNKQIGFYVWVPQHLKSFVEEQIYAQYPDVHIAEVDDYTHTADAQVVVQAAAEIKLTANEALPIKTFPSFEVDPLASITAALAQFDEDEEAWLQVVVRPAPSNWHKRSEGYVAGIRGGGSGPMSFNMIKVLWEPPGEGGGGSAPKLAEHETARASAAEAKSHKLAYETAVRLVYRGNTSAPQARMRIQAITASFKQFNTTYLNGFVAKYLGEDPRFVELYRTRTVGRKGFVCNIEEVASLYHLPHTNVETPNILWARAKTAEPPAILPLVNEKNRDEISPIAVTNFRGHNSMFGMPRSDRGRHLYIIGQTGVGKSGLLELLSISDVYSPFGFAIIDPHGDYALSVMRRVPEARVNDVIYFNPADTDFPVAFNPLEVADPNLRTHIVSELIGVLKRMFESWGPRLEYILRYTLLALVEFPEATMLDITRMLTEKKFRQDVVKHVTDPVVVNFWNVEFASWNDKFATEAVAPVLNKVGAFTANPTVRNIIGQPHSSFNIRKIMDERKILIVNLSRGLIGEDNASLLGALLVTKIQMAAMSRADMDLSERVPFYLYVDEFQNFATDSFATILSEARKYGLNLTVANQYIAQMSMEVKDAVFGNVGSIVGFRMSADDSRVMTKYFEPKFEEHDLVHMHNRHFVISMTIAGEKVQAFSATSLELPPQNQDYSPQIIAASRESYAYKKADIEDYVRDRYLTPEQLAKAIQANTKPQHNKPKPKQQQPAPAAKPAQPSAPTPAPAPPSNPPVAPTPPALTPVRPVVEKKVKDTVTKVKDLGKTVTHLVQPKHASEPAQPRATTAEPAPEKPKAEARPTPKAEPIQPPPLPAPEEQAKTKRKRTRSRRRRKPSEEAGNARPAETTRSAERPERKAEASAEPRPKAHPIPPEKPKAEAKKEVTTSNDETVIRLR